MIAYSDKIDASYAKLKAVLAEGAGAAAGFKSSLPKKSQVLTRQLSEEVVRVLLEEIMQFVMHMTSASIDQVSGRLEEKLALLGEEGFALSDETVQRVKDALSDVPGASSPVAQILNGLGKDKCLGDLEDFFKLDLRKGGEGAGEAEAAASGEGQIEGGNGKVGYEDGDLPLVDKGSREKFAKYLDETLPKTKYFNQFFQRAFDGICNFISCSALGMGGASPAEAGGSRQSDSVLQDIAVRLAQQAELLMRLSSSGEQSSVLGAGLDFGGGAGAINKVVASFDKAASRVRAAVVSFEIAVALATIAAIVVFSLASAVVAAAVVAIALAIAVIQKNVIKIFNAVKQAISLVFKMIVQAVKLVFTVIMTVVKAVVGLIVGIVAAVVVALGIVVMLGLALAVAAFLVAVAVVLAAVVVLAVLAAALVVMAAALAVVVLVVATALLVAAVVLVAAVLVAAVALVAVMAVAAVLLAAMTVVAVFVVMALSIVVLSAAIAVLAVAILAIGFALAAGVALIGAALLFAAGVLIMAVAFGVNAIFALAFASVIAVMGMAVLAAGVFMAATFVFAGMLVAGLIGLVAGVVAALLFLFLLGMVLIGKSVEEIWEYLKPHLEKIKGWWKDIKAWWEDSFIKKIFDRVAAVGGLSNFFASLWDTAKQKIIGVFTNTKIGKWIDSVLDWWDNFSFKSLLKKFWESFKAWILEKWNTFCDWLAGINIPYPNGISYQGPDHWYSKANPFNYKISWGYWYLFKYAASWKSESPNGQVSGIQPPDMPDANDSKIEEEMQQAVDEGLTGQDREQISLAKNIFEQDRLRKEAIRKRREQLHNDSVVVPQTIMYPGQPLYGGGGSAGLYSCELGGGCGR